MEDIYRNLLKIGKELFDELPKNYEPEKIEKCIIKYSAKSVLTFNSSNSPFSNFLTNLLADLVLDKVLNQISWKDAINLISSYLKELPGEDADKSFRYVVKNFFNYLKWWNVNRGNKTRK